MPTSAFAISCGLNVLSLVVEAVMKAFSQGVGGRKRSEPTESRICQEDGRGSSEQDELIQKRALLDNSTCYTAGV